MRRHSLRIVLAVIVTGLLVLVYSFWPVKYLITTKQGMTRSDLQVIGRAAQMMSNEDWQKIDGAEAFFARVVDFSEQGELIRFDAWGNPFEFEKRDEKDCVVITVRSTHESTRKWYEADQKPLGITITRYKTPQVKYLWIDD